METTKVTNEMTEESRAIINEMVALNQRFATANPTIDSPLTVLARRLMEKEKKTQEQVPLPVAETTDDLELAKMTFIDLDKDKPRVKEFFDLYSKAVEELAELGKVGFHFQDDEGTVYQVEQATGKFVYFEKFEVKRTRREGEKAGTLSLTKARELGYEVE